jgi:formylglycine-generating enzyme required for sulfatase activity
MRKKKQLKILFVIILWIFSFMWGANQKNMVFIEGGSFEMGDVFNEGRENEKPVHRVTLTGFYLGKHEVTVKEFKEFIKETGYITNAERSISSRLEKEYREKFKSEKLTAKEKKELFVELLSIMGGCYCFNPETKKWEMKPDANWKKPYFKQSNKDPVTCVSWQDAINYCNWLSEKEKLPRAYDSKTGELLDKNGKTTTDINLVKGYRLPTEAEWEYAAREKGEKKRFGNGKDIARSSEINFDATQTNFPFLKKGIFRKKTTPVGSFKPNSLGLYDMSGNVWEWCCDYMGGYEKEEKSNPIRTIGSERVARGGRWSSFSLELRVNARFSWVPANRCNNIGFRIARSK